MSDLISRRAANTKMKKYRKKPIVIDAYQTDRELDIETLEGVMHASVGDYIIIGVNGEQYPCKPDIFKKTYEEISDKDLPSAQPERKKGKWIDAVLPNDNGGLQVQVCDQCNTFFPLAYTGGGHRFCPSCGAKMEVEHE